MKIKRNEIEITIEELHQIGHLPETIRFWILRLLYEVSHVPIVLPHPKDEKE